MSHATCDALCVLATSLLVSSVASASGGYCIPDETLTAISIIVPTEPDSGESGARAVLRDSKGDSVIVRVGLTYCSDSRQRWEVVAIQPDSITLECAEGAILVTIPVGGSARLAGCLK